MASRAVRPVSASSGSAARCACRRIAAAALSVSALLFLFSPVSALWGLADAVRGNDVSALRDGTDWRALRASLKDEFAEPARPVASAATAPATVSPVAASPIAASPIAASLATVKLASAHLPLPRPGTAAAPATDDDLPEFGSSFVSNVVSNAVDDDVTPERLLALAHPADGDAGTAPASMRDALRRLAGLGFAAPDRFEVAFRISDQPDAEPVRLVLRIEHWHWKVVAVHMPSPSPEPDSTRRT